MKRREFFALAATASVASAMPPRLDTTKVPVRKVGKVEIVFKTPKPQPNGMQATKEGLWIIDQGREGNWAHLVTYEGKVIKGFETETMASSGITFDGNALWVGSTYSRETIKCDASTGKALAKFNTPGAGVIYRMAGDAPSRQSPVPQEMRQPRPEAPGQQGGGGQGGGGGRGQGRGRGGGGAAPGMEPNPGATRLGTGAHGQEWRDGKLWYVCPPSRMAYRMNVEEWVVEQQWPVVGNRPHGIGWEGRYLWVADSNLNAFHKHDPETGDVLEMIQLADNDPLPHGMTIWEGNLWYCDDVGLVCRLKMS